MRRRQGAEVAVAAGPEKRHAPMRSSCVANAVARLADGIANLMVFALGIPTSIRDAACPYSPASTARPALVAVTFRDVLR